MFVVHYSVNLCVIVVDENKGKVGEERRGEERGM
jgi:hypothetical protein